MYCWGSLSLVELVILIRWYLAFTLFNNFLDIRLEIVILIADIKRYILDVMILLGNSVTEPQYIKIIPKKEIVYLFTPYPNLLNLLISNRMRFLEIANEIISQQSSYIL